MARNGALTMFTVSVWTRISPASTALVIGFWLRFAAAPSTSIAIPVSAPCASWPTKLPSFSASAI